MANKPTDDFWPRPLRHLARPFVADTDEGVVIGEISGEAIGGFHGARMLFTALVPKGDASDVLRTPGGIGHGVDCNGPHPSVGPDGGYRPSFWISGQQRSSRFDTLIHTWTVHNKTVMMPDNGLLMCFGLVPRLLSDGGISWDDPKYPVYDVVRVIPLSEYSIRGGHTTAQIVIQRDYLEDYLSLTGCVAIATYFEERYSSNDLEIEELLGGREGVSYALPGREIWIKRSQADWLGNQLSQVWGCSLLLVPQARPISEGREGQLTWPDRAKPIRGRPRGGFGALEHVYVRDEVLVEYEKRREFEINPESGSVSYDGWWSVSYCRRHGRNHIEIELRKLYEGVPFNVIEHFNKFAVSREIAERDCGINGTRHIGDRAREFVYAFLQLTAALAEVSDVIGLSFTQEDIGTITTADVTYKGWWTFPTLSPLGHVVPLSLPFPYFLSRCAELFKFFENLAPAPLRHVLIRLGIKKDDITAFKSLKLLSTLCQLATIASKNGFDLVSDSAHISGLWDKSLKLGELRPVFALNMLRTAEAHLSSHSTISEALETFSIDQNQCQAGWGKALDTVYDQVILSLIQTEQLLGRAQG